MAEYVTAPEPCVSCGGDVLELRRDLGRKAQPITCGVRGCKEQHRLPRKSGLLVLSETPCARCGHRFLLDAYQRKKPPRTCPDCPKLNFRKSDGNGPVRPETVDRVMAALTESVTLDDSTPRGTDTEAECPKCGAPALATTTDLPGAGVRQTVIRCRADGPRCEPTIIHEERTQEPMAQTTVDKTCTECRQSFQVPWTSRARKRCDSCVAKLPKHGTNGKPAEDKKLRTCAMPGCSNWWSATEGDEASLCSACREKVATPEPKEPPTTSSIDAALRDLPSQGQEPTAEDPAYEVEVRRRTSEPEAPLAPETPSESQEPTQEQLSTGGVAVTAVEEQPALRPASTDRADDSNILPRYQLIGSPLALPGDRVLAAVLALEALPRDARERVLTLVERRDWARAAQAEADEQLAQLQQEVA